MLKDINVFDQQTYVDSHYHTQGMNHESELLYNVQKASNGSMKETMIENKSTAFVPHEIVKAKQLREEVHQHLKQRIEALTKIRDYIEK